MVLSNLITAYGFGRIQDLLTLYTELEQSGYTMDDLTERIEGKRRLLKKREVARNILNTQKCPECGAVLDFGVFNTGPANRTDDGINSVFDCQSCQYVFYSEMTANQWLVHLYKRNTVSDK